MHSHLERITLASAKLWRAAVRGSDPCVGEVQRTVESLTFMVTKPPCQLHPVYAATPALHLADPKISYLYIPIIGEEDVLRFDVAVENFVGVDAL